MKYILTFTFLFNFHYLCFSQIDSVVKRRVKGLIFMPEYNSYYDSCCPGEISYDYSDYFFPFSYPETNLFYDTNICVHFRNCIRIEPNKFRGDLKSQAVKFTLIDSSWSTHWYGLHTVFFVAVVIDYYEYEDSFPKMAMQDSFELQVNQGANLFFHTKRRAIRPIKIKILSTKPRSP